MSASIADMVTLTDVLYDEFREYEYYDFTNSKDCYLSVAAILLAQLFKGRLDEDEMFSRHFSVGGIAEACLELLREDGWCMDSYCGDSFYDQAALLLIGLCEGSLECDDIFQEDCSDDLLELVEELGICSCSDVDELVSNDAFLSFIEREGSSVVALSHLTGIDFPLNMDYSLLCGVGIHTIIDTFTNPELSKFLLQRYGRVISSYPSHITSLMYSICGPYSGATCSGTFVWVGDSFYVFTCSEPYYDGFSYLSDMDGCINPLFVAYTQLFSLVVREEGGASDV